jgi:hypothetical protein
MKRIFGVLMLVVGNVFVIATVFAMFPLVPDGIGLTNQTFFLLGKLIALALIATVCFFIIRTGLKLTKGS